MWNGVIYDNNFPEGISYTEEKIFGYTVQTVDLPTSRAGALLKRSPGKYIVVQTDPIDELEEYEPLIQCLTKVLSDILQTYYGKRLFICGLGNRKIPADALGPEVLSRLPLYLSSANELGIKCNFQNVCGFTPGVTWENNIPTEELLAAAAKKTKSDCVLVIDSCITEKGDNLFKSIQFSTAGGPTRRFGGGKIDWSIVDAPIVSIVMPTVIQADKVVKGAHPSKLLTSTDIHNIISTTGILLASTILQVCWPSISIRDCIYLAKIENDPVPIERWTIESENRKFY